MALLSGCASHPLGYLEGAAGPAARPLQSIAVGLTLIAVVGSLVTGLLLAAAIVNGRRKAKREGDGVKGHGGGLPWIWWGTGLTFPIFVAMAVWTLVTTRAVAEQQGSSPVTLEITGHRWWWEVRYRTPEPAGDLLTADDIVIPVGVPVRLKLMSADVIHSFWVPKLAGKMDMIPGHTNSTWFQADTPGIYRGQCMEFCGLEHARMAFTVRAVPREAFLQWYARNLAPAAAAAQQALFTARCGLCHAVRGTSAGGLVGPDLTHVASRPTLAAGTLPMTLPALDLWLHDTQGVKPGSYMPQVPLSDTERKAIVTYLAGLK
ncbi:cytochrome c oxidase subunit II [Sphingomonas ginkgonis]|uniref:cytochrome c oxidase subunit II n=1 Tax=Sphingomonas ginkgonis TaxID=2315330 RepID=UPI001639710F|nr:cytochrome c oxidase subunit II [Sphingomonas ginkgonis]